MNTLARLSFSALALVCLMMVAGCGTTADESANASSRPWNSPVGWENGMPVGLTEGR